MTHPFKPQVQMNSREAVSLLLAAHCRFMESYGRGRIMPFDDTVRAEADQDLQEITEALHWLCATVGTRENSRDVREVAE